MKTVICMTVENERKFKDNHSNWEVDWRVERDGIMCLNRRYSDTAEARRVRLKSLGQSSFIRR
jgi:CYTH domain-containing protein